MSKSDRLRWPKASLGEWLRAWRDVLRDPDKRIPEPNIPPEGDPIPPELELRCPECGYSLTGLREWRCPECGEPFNPRRAYTLRMLREPEYFLRYRLGPEDIRRGLWTLVLLIAGIVLIGIAFVTSGAATAAPGSRRMAQFFVGLYAMYWMVGLSIPSLILIKFLLDLPWIRVAFPFSVIWCIAASLLLIASRF